MNELYLRKREFPQNNTFSHSDNVFEQNFFIHVLKVKPVTILNDFYLFRCERSVNKSRYIVNY